MGGVGTLVNGGHLCLSWWVARTRQFYGMRQGEKGASRRDSQCVPRGVMQVCTNETGLFRSSRLDVCSCSYIEYQEYQHHHIIATGPAIAVGARRLDLKTALLLDFC